MSWDALLEFTEFILWIITLSIDVTICQLKYELASEFNCSLFLKSTFDLLITNELFITE